MTELHDFDPGLGICCKCGMTLDQWRLILGDPSEAKGCNPKTEDQWFAMLEKILNEKYKNLGDGAAGVAPTSQRDDV